MNKKSRKSCGVIHWVHDYESYGFIIAQDFTGKTKQLHFRFDNQVYSTGDLLRFEIDRSRKTAKRIVLIDSNDLSQSEAKDLITTLCQFFDAHPTSISNSRTLTLRERKVYNQLYIRLVQLAISFRSSTSATQIASRLKKSHILRQVFVDLDEEDQLALINESEVDHLDFSIDTQSFTEIKSLGKKVFNRYLENSNDELIDRLFERLAVEGDSTLLKLAIHSTKVCSLMTIPQWIVISEKQLIIPDLFLKLWDSWSEQSKQVFIDPNQPEILKEELISNLITVLKINVPLINWGEFLKKDNPTGYLLVSNKHLESSEILTVVYSLAKAGHLLSLLNHQPQVLLELCKCIGSEQSEKELYEVTMILLRNAYEVASIGKQDLSSKLKYSLAEILSEFTVDDLKLALNWAKIKSLPDRPRQIKGNLLKMINARAGEITVRKVLSACHFEVEDTAICQIKYPNDSRWRLFDLVANESSKSFSIDVKTARYRRDTSQSEFLVKDYNKSPHTYIAGVYSDMVFGFDYDVNDSGVFSLKCGGQWKIYLKGLVNVNELKKKLDTLSNFLANPNVTFEGIISGHRLPFWVFSLSELLPQKEISLEQRDFVITYISHILKRTHPDKVLRHLKIGLMTILNVEGLRTIVPALTDSYFLTLAKITIHLNSFDYHTICLSILYDWMTCHLDGGRTYDSTLFSGLYEELDEKLSNSLGYKRQAPKRGLFLGVLDNDGHIYNLIQLLNRIHGRGSVIRLHNFTRFRFNFDKMILRGFHGDKPCTIFTYCGGKKLDVNYPCLTQNINIGDHQTCAQCNFLICPNCYTCKVTCDFIKRRQKYMKFDKLLMRITDSLNVGKIYEHDLHFLLYRNEKEVIDKLTHNLRGSDEIARVANLIQDIRNLQFSRDELEKFFMEDTSATHILGLEYRLDNHQLHIFNHITY